MCLFGAMVSFLYQIREQIFKSLGDEGKENDEINDNKMWLILMGFKKDEKSHLVTTF